MPRPPITILDIAASLGISKTAVSAALSGTGRVSAATRERVLAEADRLGYVTNRAAPRALLHTALLLLHHSNLRTNLHCYNVRKFLHKPPLFSQ